MKDKKTFIKYILLQILVIIIHIIGCVIVTSIASFEIFEPIFINIMFTFLPVFFLLLLIIPVWIISERINIEKKQFIKAFIATLIIFLIIVMMVYIKIGIFYAPFLPSIAYFLIVFILETITYNIVKKTKEEKKKELSLLKNAIIIYIFTYIIAFTTNIFLGIMALTIGLIILLIKTETKLSYLILTAPLLYILIFNFYPNDILMFDTSYGFFGISKQSDWGTLAVIFILPIYLILLCILEGILFFIMKMIKKYKKKKVKEEIIVEKEERTKKGEIQKFAWAIALQFTIVMSDIGLIIAYSNASSNMFMRVLLYVLIGILFIIIVYGITKIFFKTRLTYFLLTLPIYYSLAYVVQKLMEDNHINLFYRIIKFGQW